MVRVVGFRLSPEVFVRPSEAESWSAKLVAVVVTGHWTRPPPLMAIRVGGGGGRPFV